MIENRQKKYIFLHNPKTGGSTVTDVLVDQGGAKKLGRLHWSALRCDMEAPERFYDPEYFVFAFVRNPYSRVLSWYYWIQHEFTQGRKRENVRRPPDTFGQFVRKYKNHKIHQDEREIEPFIWAPQADFLGLPYSPVHVYRFEELSAELLESLPIGLKNIDLPHKNNNPHPKPADIYNHEIQQIIKRRFRKDFEMFGYDPDKLPGR